MSNNNVTLHCVYFFHIA